MGENEMLKEINELDEKLCSYCKRECQSEVTEVSNNYCKESYQNYLEENGITELAVKMRKKIKIKVERGK